MRTRTGIFGAAVIVVAAVAAGIAFAWRLAIAPIAPPTAASFTNAEITTGATLAALGNCMSCHTTATGRPYAGGQPLATPFGTIYGTNITPDAETGIGRWSEAAFSRALHEGIDRSGQYLYPAFPYDHFTKLTDADTRALYAFMMTREAVHAVGPQTRLPFPLDMRILLAGWDALFLNRTPIQPQAAHDASWNRGAYLVEGVAHCGACHTPRNLFGAEKEGAAFAGGLSDGWLAPPLDGKGAGATRWTVDALAAYLRRGWTPAHGAAAGPMQEVIGNLSRAPDADVHAIATYVASLSGAAPPAAPMPQIAAASSQDGAAIFAATCAQCHDGTRPPPLGGIKLTASTAAKAATADDFVHIVLEGVHQGAGHAGPLMPGLASALDNGQIAALAAYVRDMVGAPAWQGVDSLAQQVRAHDNS